MTLRTAAPARRVKRMKPLLLWTVAGTSVAVMYLQWTHMWMLRAEVDELRRVVSEYHRLPERKTHPGVRDKRDVTEQKRQRRQNDEDITVLSWAVGKSRGNGLQVSGDTVTVVTEGTYFIYSQVLYKDSTWVMGHVITKKLKGAESKLMKCLKSMPSNISQPLNTCYTAGIHFLESGSTLQLSVPRTSAELILTAHATFMGILNI